MKSRYTLTVAGREEALVQAAKSRDKDECLRLLEKGIDPNWSDAQGNTPLHFVCGLSFSDDMSVPQKLVEVGADVNAKNVMGGTPLHAACHSGNAAIVELLVENGAYLDPINSSGFTPLDLATHGGIRRFLGAAMNRRQALEETVGYIRERNNFERTVAEDRGWSKQRPAVNTGRVATLDHTAHHQPEKWQKSAHHKPHAFKSQTLAREPSGSTLPYRSDETNSDNEQLESLLPTELPSKPQLARDPSGTTILIEESNKAKKTTNTESSYYEWSKDAVQAANLATESYLMDEQQMLEQMVEINSMMDAAASLSKENSWLATLEDNFDQLYDLAIEKKISEAEEVERRAIMTDRPTREFYCMMLEKLDCTIRACQTLASGMVDRGNNTSMAVWLASLVKETSLKDTLKNTPVGKLVGDSVKWAAKQVPLPFMETFGTIFHALCSMKNERDKYLAVARVATFASVANEMGGLHRVIARICRIMVRSGRYVKNEVDYPEWQHWALQMLGDPASTPAKSQGCLAAEQVLNCIMEPTDDCPVVAILEGRDLSSELDVAVALRVLGDEEALHDLLAPQVPPSLGNQYSSPQSSILPEAAAANSQLNIPPDVATENSLPVPEKGEKIEAVDVSKFVSHDAFEKMQRRLDQLDAENKRLKHQISKVSENNGGTETEVEGENGYLFQYATNEEKYEGRLEALECAVRDVLQQISCLTTEQVVNREVLEGQLLDLEQEISHVKEDRKNGNRHKAPFLKKITKRRDP